MTWAKPFKNLLTAPPSITAGEPPLPDPRWLCIGRPNMICKCCDTHISELFSLAYHAPEDWPHPGEKYENGQVLSAIDDILTQDFCIIRDRHFIRAVMIIPVTGLDTPIILGLWVEVHKQDFNAYLQTMPTGKQGAMDLIFCTIANIIPDQPKNIACVMQPRDDFQRPIVHAAVDCDKLFVDQLDGFDFDQLISFLDGFGHHFAETV